jgi:hypothetical protein
MVSFDVKLKEVIDMVENGDRTKKELESIINNFSKEELTEYILSVVEDYSDEENDLGTENNEPTDF